VGAGILRNIPAQEASKGMSTFSRRRLQIGLLVIAATALAGCRAVPVHEQILVSAPAMAPGEELIWSSEERLGAQVEGGRAFAGGGQSAGCTSCQ